jgi:hypothetical protein
MSGFSLSSSTSALGLEAIAFSLKVSRSLQRHPLDLPAALQMLITVLERAPFLVEGGFEISQDGQEPAYWSFGTADHTAGSNLFGEHGHASHRVRVWLSTLQAEGEEAFALLPEYLAQQITLYLELWNLHEANRAMKEELGSERDSLALRKRLDRAKGIIASRNALTLPQAEEFLHSASVRTGKPLLDVVGDILLVFGGSEESIRLEQRRSKRRRNQRRARGRMRSVINRSSPERQRWAGMAST